MWLARFVGMALLIGVAVGPAIADDHSSAGKPAPLDDDTRTRWMAHIVRGLVELATESDPPLEHYRYCASGFTALSSLEVSRAVSRAALRPNGSRPWLTPIFVATPDYRPYASSDICPGGQFLFGDIDGDVLAMLNTHRRKQRTAIPDWPHARDIAKLRMFGEGNLQDIPDYVFQSGENQMFADEHGFSHDVTSPQDLLVGSCPAQAHSIVFYFRFTNKEVRDTAFEERYTRLRGGGYRLACLTVDNDTLHIDLTDRLYKPADLY